MNTIMSISMNVNMYIKMDINIVMFVYQRVRINKKHMVTKARSVAMPTEAQGRGGGTSTSDVGVPAIRGV